jgi:fluoroquinolone transport system ATP-binding protein
MSAAVVVEDLVFRYPGSETPAVQNISFEVAAGEVLGFLGPSGAGKSTTQKILIKLLEGYEGRASVLGKEIAAWGDDFYERVGVSFELPASYRKLTARENLQVFAGLYRGKTREPMELLELVGLEDAADQRVAQYSKGMQMRLNVARALLNEPELLFLDEPTGGLDPGNARRVKELVKAEQERGTSVFLTTHDMIVADELCDRVAFIVDGQLPVIAPPRELKLEHGQRRAIVEVTRADGRQRHEVALDALPETLSRFDEEGASIETVHSGEATLEQVFLAVTGRELS